MVRRLVTTQVYKMLPKIILEKGVADPKKVLDGIDGSISHEINEALQSSFKGDEEVLEFCLGVLNDGKGIESANTTDIVLIPKISQPTTLVNFRPISLCTIMYKLMTKTIANRLQDVIGNCIDKAQSAFVPGRLILDNLMNCYIHFEKKGKKGYMAVKLDMSKAYDRVEWDFVKQVMRKMGFAIRWIDLIMKCITTVSYAVIINGNRGCPFQPTRGLRQGDPLRPLSPNRSAKTKGLVKGAMASRKGPEISHLLFADDCILFGETTEKEARILKEILKEYEGCSGQRVNFNKSTIFYSSNTREESKAVVSTLLGVRSSSSPKKYLGLPNMVGRRKKEAFFYLLIGLQYGLRLGAQDYYLSEGKRFL
ncbi:reverse transcriptase [Gossypium australe]|uniref:Reverse transcriptase n=1 Tax=Gossypium australe TaxID=47621 RepID=A0A5B6VK05_9ROSI|nr:reverse transcriptase [Gossypium australe]